MTYTIRQVGCAAWVEHIDAQNVPAEYRSALNAGLKHVIIVDDDTGEDVTHHIFLSDDDEDENADE